MSKLIPRRTIDVVRNYVDVALDIIGITCTLYLPTNVTYSEAEKLDVYSVPEDLEYVSYTANVFLEWKPSTNKLKQLGLFTDDGQLPILVRFGNVATALEGSEAGEKVNIDVSLRSWFRIEPEFVPQNYEGTEDFEVVDVAVKNMHDAALTRIYAAAPRRVKRSS